MSFSGNVKEELAGQISNARHCQIAECAAILYFSAGAAMEEEEHPVLKLSTENIAVARKYFTLLEKAFNIKAEISIRRNQDKKSILYLIAVGGRKQTERILQAAKLVLDEPKHGGFLGVSSLVYQNGCCKRAFFRGAFLTAGSMSDPHKSYHFEIVCASEEKAELLKKLIQGFEMDAKVVKRKKSFVVFKGRHSDFTGTECDGCAGCPDGV